MAVRLGTHFIVDSKIKNYNSVICNETIMIICYACDKSYYVLTRIIRNVTVLIQYLYSHIDVTIRKYVFFVSVIMKWWFHTRSMIVLKLMVRINFELQRISNSFNSKNMPNTSNNDLYNIIKIKDFLLVIIYVQMYFLFVKFKNYINLLRIDKMQIYFLKLA